MDLFLGWAAFGGAVLFICVLRSLLVGWAGWRPGAATMVGLGVPLAAAGASIALALADSSAPTAGSGGMALLAVPLFSLCGLAVGLFGVGLSKLVRGEFSSPRH